MRAHAVISSLLQLTAPNQAVHLAQGGLAAGHGMEAQFGSVASVWVSETLDPLSTLCTPSAEDPCTAQPVPLTFQPSAQALSPRSACGSVPSLLKGTSPPWGQAGAVWAAPGLAKCVLQGGGIPLTSPCLFSARGEGRKGKGHRSLLSAQSQMGPACHGHREFRSFQQCQVVIGKQVRNEAFGRKGSWGILKRCWSA